MIKNSVFAFVVGMTLSVRALSTLTDRALFKWPSQEEQRCIELIRSTFYSHWNGFSYSADLKPVHLMVEFRDDGKVDRFYIIQGSGNKSVDDSVLKAAKEIGSIHGLSLQFLKRFPKVEIEMSVLPDAARSGSPCEAEQGKAKLLHEAGDLALFVGETDADAVFNAKPKQKDDWGIRNSLFPRRQAQVERRRRPASPPPPCLNGVRAVPRPPRAHTRQSHRKPSPIRSSASILTQSTAAAAPT